ncbi:hypothetical protein WT33_18470 [Burkholderia stagnalis]|nr:hypothetical protein WT33_18470 [Burkholderia stagnalis]
MRSPMKCLAIQDYKSDTDDSSDRLVALFPEITNSTRVNDVDIDARAIESIACQLIDQHIGKSLKDAARLAYRIGMTSGIRGETQFAVSFDD